jgi:hypothetical protein
MGGGIFLGHEFGEERVGTVVDARCVCMSLPCDRVLQSLQASLPRGSFDVIVGRLSIDSVHVLHFGSECLVFEFVFSFPDLFTKFFDFLKLRE